MPSDCNLLDQLAEEFPSAFVAEKGRPLSEYIEKHPQLAEEIQDVFPALVMMEQSRPGSER